MNRFLLAICLLLTAVSLAAAQPPNIPGQQSTIRAIFDCTTGVCTNVSVSDGELLDFSSVSVTTTTEGLLLPQHATDCSSGTAEGQACWDADSDELNIGTGAGVITLGGGGAGDVTAVFNCTEDDCASISLADDTDLLDMSAVSVTTTTEGLILPQHATTCAASTAEGQVCWEADADILWIGTGGTVISLGGDITTVFNCTSGDCASVALADGDLLDMSSVSVTALTEGLILPQHATDCSAATAEGQVCWQADTDILYVGDGSTAVAAAGDITDVFSCGNGDCNSITVADGDFLNFAGITPNTNTEGLKLPQSDDCSAQTSEGLICWDTDNDILYIGNGSMAIQAGAGDITDVYDCTDGNCSSIALSDGDLLDMSSVSVTTLTEGLLLPQHATDCSAATAEGQVCWQADTDVLYIGDGATAQAATGDITAVFNCTDGDCGPSIALADGDLLDMSSVSVTTLTEGLLLPQHATDCSAATAEGQVCWQADTDTLYIGDGTGTRILAIEQIWDCTSGDCGTLTLADGDLLDMSSVSVTTLTEGLILPQHATDCSAATAEGQLCWEQDADRLFIGDSATTFEVGDIRSVYGCTDGACTSISLADTQLLNMSSVSVTTTTEGLILPQHATDCSASTAEGQVCWNASTDLLSIGDGSTAIIIAQGDITDVFDCNTGNCNAITLTDGDGLDMSNVDPNSAGEGLILPQNPTDCSSSTVEGQACWDADSDELSIGTSGGVITIGGGGAGDVTAVFNCTADDCASISLADNTDLLDMSAVSVTTTTEGLILPQHATDCSAATAEGQVCWQRDTELLYVGNGSTAISVSQTSVTLDDVFDNGKEIDGANSQVNAVVFSDGTDGWRFYVGANGPVQECFIGAGACDHTINVASGNDFVLQLIDTPQLTISSAGVVTLGESLEEIKNIPFPAGMLVVDGLQCLRNTDPTINSETFRSSVTCSDSEDDAATFKLDFVAPAAWDEAELTVTVVGFQGDATPDGNIEFDVSGYCAGNNDPLGTDTFTAEDANGVLTLAASSVATNDELVGTSVGQVPIGTCSETDLVRLRFQLDSTATTAASPEDIHLLWVIVHIAYNEWSN